MLCARDAPDQRFRGIEGQICGRICGGDGMIACFGALLCVLSGGMQSDAQCPVSACVCLWLAHAEQRASGALEGVQELRRERQAETMCGHCDAGRFGRIPGRLIAVSNCLNLLFYSL